MMAYAMAPVFGAGLIGVAAVSAHGLGGFGGGLSPDEIAARQDSAFQRDATAFGFTVDELKDAWADGKSPIELAKEKGLTEEQIQEKLRASREADLKASLDVMVTKGILTRSQADRRLNAIKKNVPGHGGRGFRGHLGMERGR
ncbi:MAG: hypothetical protein RLZZ324_832 [Candidatus Parcubacteria bacterium]|jgi:hypothetical protein